MNGAEEALASPTISFIQNDDIQSRSRAVALVDAFLGSIEEEERSAARSSIVFEDLRVEGAGRGVQVAPTVRTMVQSLPNRLDPRRFRARDRSRTLLHGFHGTIAPGEMMLVIGRPGSGCTTFLKTMAGMRDEYKDTSGLLTYGGRPANQQADDPVRATFCAEEDAHLPLLTVRETLTFAIRATSHGSRSAAAVKAATEALARCFGLAGVMDTRVGNEAIRGVSGGERKRVSLAEALATCPDVLCLDNPTNGLDSSTALEVLQVVREFTRKRRCATLISLYQGSESMARIFDSVLVINHGHQIFQGAIADAESHFKRIGFVRGPRTTITDFLSSMTGDMSLRSTRAGYENAAPRTPLQLAGAFRSSIYYAPLLDAVAQTKQQTPNPASPRQVFSLPIHLQIAFCASRQFTVLMREYHTWLVEAACLVVQSLFLGTLYRDKKHVTGSFFVLESSLFYAVLVPSLRAMNEFGNTFGQRGLVIRQRRYRFYRPLSYALGLLGADALAAFVAVACNIPQYFMTGFQPDAGKFFTWLTVLFVLHLAMSMLFRACAVFASSMERAVLPVGVGFNCLVMYTGLYVTPKSMRAWLGWLRWLNPMYYAFESVIASEFGNLDYSCSDADVAPGGRNASSFDHFVCAVPGADAGRFTVSGSSFIADNFSFHTSHIWRNVGINAAIFAFFAVVSAFGMERYKLPAGRLATVFFKAEPDEIRVKSPGTSSDSDREKGEVDGDAPPLTQPHSRASRASRQVSAMSQHPRRPLVWHDLSLDVKVKGESRRLLDHLDGSVEPGSLTALMGVSGAGKTTLLNALAGRLEGGNQSGTISLGSESLPPSFGSRMGYVQQQDVHLPTQTVREALQMTSCLRPAAGKRASKSSREAHVEALISLLEMEDFADALIGRPGAGLNLEQRKRVTIGVELAMDPEILFLDEPTSGLDGQSAMQIVKLLAKLARDGFTVLCTIHQPAAELIEHFDHLILLVQGGKLAYDGSLGVKCETAITYFARHARPCQPHENPAEYFLEVVGAGSPDGRQIDWEEAWRCSEERKQRSIQLSAITCQLSQPRSVPESSTAPFSTQFAVLVRRTWLYYWREPDYLASKLAMSVGSALLNALTYMNPSLTLGGASNRIFSAFVSLIVGPPLALQTVPRFIVLRDIYQQRERARGIYRWPALVSAALAVEAPYALLTGLSYWLVWYYPVFHAGVSGHSDRAGYNLLGYLLFQLWTHALAQLISAASPTASAALAANGFVFFLFNTFAGTLSPRPSTPRGWVWFFNISPLYYLAEGVVTSALQGLRLRCDEADAVVFQPPEGQSCSAWASGAMGYVLNADANADCLYCKYREGQGYVSPPPTHDTAKPTFTPY
ncbi:hypothetical protein VTK73DRAFT_7872 [Phialemonium thermophilum]|uniref:ABC transporter domain-containing protein n=1 Tax=Phialemonium thermophilum TaxID=223376 RepID=A0ABR3XS15_9PEZI